MGKRAEGGSVERGRRLGCVGKIFKKVKRKRGGVLGKRGGVCVWGNGGKVWREGGGWAVWVRFLRK